MISKASLRYIRISPRKVRPVIALVKGKKADDAISTLHGIKKKASALLIDVISSAVTNASRIPGTDVSNLYISNLIANGGPQLKRFRAASMGRASGIRKRTSHITVELDVYSGNDKRVAPQAAVAEGAAREKRVKISNVKKSVKIVPAKRGKE